MENCVFCKIAERTSKSYKIWEDEKYVAFLDIYPNIKGATIVIPKEHTNSYIFDQTDEQIEGIMVAAKKVAKILEKGLKVGRVNIVFEGLMIDHLHAKLYPAIGISKGFKEVTSNERVWFERYEGYISTQLGFAVNDEYLKKLQDEIIDSGRS
ncbi:MAG: HIT domain-containing protein [Candidatus Marsarchaeota archaeon]|nr:HIT domain-containing protein [Candidatus Marsarchaeota archaeon]